MRGEGCDVVIAQIMNVNWLMVICELCDEGDESSLRFVM